MKRDEFLPNSKVSKILAMIAATLLLAGCAHRYDMTLTNGLRITNVTKPVLDRDNEVYVYKDVSGKVRKIGAGRVIEIAPHSTKNVTPGTLQ